MAPHLCAGMGAVVSQHRPSGPEQQRFACAAHGLSHSLGHQLSSAEGLGSFGQGGGSAGAARTWRNAFFEIEKVTECGWFLGKMFWRSNFGSIWKVHQGLCHVLLSSAKPSQTICTATCPLDWWDDVCRRPIISFHFSNFLARWIATVWRTRTEIFFAICLEKLRTTPCLRRQNVFIKWAPKLDLLWSTHLQQASSAYICIRQVFNPSALKFWHAANVQDNWALHEEPPQRRNWRSWNKNEKTCCLMWRNTRF